MNYAHLDFKLKLRRYLLKVEERGAPRGVLLNNFRTVPKTVFDAVIEECLREGTLSVVTGNRGAQVYTWCDSAVASMEGR